MHTARALPPLPALTPPARPRRTRLQSPQGFFKSGGFTGIYRGLSVAASGSVPGAALFFSSYETGKAALAARNVEGPSAHMTAASAAECVACLVRVPVEVVKQRMQAGLYASMFEGFPKIMAEAGVGGFYTGYAITVAREIPFAMIQFPLYEAAKDRWSEAQGARVNSVQAAACGAGAGGIAAAATTPLDVIKTRLMLGNDAAGVAYTGMVDTATRIYTTEGAKTLFSGIGPRVFWITTGGFVFFGAYEKAKRSTWYVRIEP